MFFLLFVFFSTDVAGPSDTIVCSVSVSKGSARLDGSGTKNAIEFIVVADALAVVDQQHCESHGGSTAATATAPPPPPPALPPPPAVSNDVIGGDEAAGISGSTADAALAKMNRSQKYIAARSSAKSNQGNELQTGRATPVVDSCTFASVDETAAADVESVNDAALTKMNQQNEIQVHCANDLINLAASDEAVKLNEIAEETAAVVRQQHRELHDGGTATAATAVAAAAAVSNSVIQGGVGSIDVANTHPTNNAVSTPTGVGQHCRAAHASSLSGNGAKEFASVLDGNGAAKGFNPMIVASNTPDALNSAACSELGVGCASENTGGKLICFP